MNRMAISFTKPGDLLSLREGTKDFTFLLVLSAPKNDPERGQMWKVLDCNMGDVFWLTSKSMHSRSLRVFSLGQQ